MVMIAAAIAADHGLALNRRTRMKTSTANGTAISEMRKSPGRPTTWSISGGSSGVRSRTHAAGSDHEQVREVSPEVIAWVNAHSSFLRTPAFI